MESLNFVLIIVEHLIGTVKLVLPKLLLVLFLLGINFSAFNL